jgi:hypothetical protein
MRPIKRLLVVRNSNVIGSVGASWVDGTFFFRNSHLLFDDRLSCFVRTEAAEKKSLKRKAVASSTDNDSGGYNSDDDEGRSDRQADSFGLKEEGDESIMDDDGEDGSGDQGSGQTSSRKNKKLNDMKREERNAREKERSFRISRQINELRNLLSSGGVIVPKGTKSSVLTEAANYIRMLQQHQYRSEM